MNQINLFDLQLFAENEPAFDVDPDGKNGEPGGEETITFKSQAAFYARMQREAKKIFEAQLKELGFESADHMKSTLQNAQADLMTTKTALEKEKDRADKAETAKNQAIETANQTLKEAAAQLQAIAANVKPQCLKTFLKLIDFNTIQFKDGIIDESSVQAAVQTVLDQIPELAKPTHLKAGEDFGQGNDLTQLTLEQIARMTPAEINKNWNKVQTFLKQQPNRR
jgi:hypothetical protein